MVLGNQVVRLQSRELAPGNYALEVAISDDGGDTWNPPTALAPDSVTAYIRPMAATRGHLLVLGENFLIHNSPRAVATISDRSGQIWAPFQPIIATQTSNEYIKSIAGDTASETAMVCLFQGSDITEVSDLYVVRTIDGGATWEPPHALTSGGLMFTELDAPQVFCQDKLWGIFWENYWDSDSTHWGIHFSFSANHGKDWYPPSFLGWDLGDMYFSGGEFVGQGVRGYWNSPGVNDLGTMDGILTPDTIAPMISMGVPLADEIAPGSEVQFLASAADNDSLPYMQVVLRKQDSIDSIIVPLPERVSPTDYRGFWTVPNDTALWHYYYRAEDMWENVSVFPDTGVFSFHTEGWSAGDAIRPYGPLSFSVQVYPNPSNGWPRIQLSPEWFAHGAVTVGVYNVLGQRVWEKRLMSVGLRAMQSAPTVYVSGVYVVKVTNGQHSMLQKFVVLK
jgi:hypothetical protein